MSPPPIGHRRAYPALLLLVPLVAGACATARPGAATGTPTGRASVPVGTDQRNGCPKAPAADR